MRQEKYRHDLCSRSGRALGCVLLGAGIILLFASIPAWAWLALTGFVLVAAGFLLLKLCRAWR